MSSITFDPIITLENPSREDFERCLVGEGFPVVIKSSLNHWPALQKWSVESVSSELKALTVRPNTDIIRKTGQQQPFTTLGAFAERVLQGDLRDDGIADGLYGSPYVSFSLGQLGSIGTRMLAEFNPDFPFLQDVLASGEYPFNQFMFHLPFANLFIGPKGTRAFMHNDFWGSHTYIAMLEGEKQAFLFPPSMEKQLTQADGKKLDVLQQHEGPNLRGITGTIAAGDLPFLPPNWFHDVISLKTSLSLSWNGFTKHNVGNLVLNMLRDPGKVASL